MASDAEVDLIVNATGALADVQRDLDRLVREAENGADPIQLRAIMDRQESALRLRGELDDLIRRTTAAAPDIRVRADVDVDDADRNTRRLTDTFGRLVQGAGSVLGPLASVGAGVGAVGLAAGAAVPLIAGLVTAVESVLPASAVAVQGMIAIQLASGAVKIGMIGVSEAIETAFDPEAKPEDLAKAMEKLAPEARSFVGELVKMRPAFDALRIDVQNRLFADMDEAVSVLGKSVLPQLRGSLSRSADSLNDMALGAAAAALQLSESGVLGQALDGATKGLSNLETIPGNVVKSLGFLGAAAAPAFDRLTKGASRAVEEIAKSLESSFESGGLERAIDIAIENIKQLGRIAGNIFGGLGNIFQGLSQDGEGLFGTLEKISQAFEDFTGSEEFQSALSELSKTAAELVSTALPLVLGLLEQLLPVFEELGPPVRELIRVLGESLKPVIEELGPVFLVLAQAVGELVPVFTPFLELALELAADILPLLTPLLETLRDIFIELQPVAEQLAENIGSQLKPILEELPGILEELLPHFVKMAEELFPVLLEALIELSPALAEMGIALAELAVALTPLIEKFLEFQIFLIEELGPIIGPLADLIGGILVGALMALADFITAFVIPAVETITALLEGDFQGATLHAAEFTENMRDRAVQAFHSMRDEAANAFGGLVTNALARVGNLRSGVIGTLTGLVGDAIARVGDMRRGFVGGITGLVNDAVARIAELPSRILGALPALGSLLFRQGQAIIQGLIDGVVSKIDQLTSVLGSLTRLIPKNKGPMPVDKVLLTPNGIAIMDSLIRGIESRIPELRSQLSGLTSTIPDLVVKPLGVSGGQLSMAAPSVVVQVGNRVLNEYVDYRVVAINDDRDRTFAQGVRR